MLVGIVTIIISAIVVFNNQLVWLLALFPGLYIAYAFFIAYSKAPSLKEGLHLTHSEKQAWKEHHAFFRFPLAARKMAGSLSFLQFISVILAIVLVVTGAYWGIAFLLGWFLGLPTPRLNPEGSIVPAAQRGNLDAIERLKALESLQAKLKSPDKHTKSAAPPKHSKPEQSQSDYDYLVNKYLPNKNEHSKQSELSSPKRQQRTPPRIAIIGIANAGVATINRIASYRLPTKRFIAIDSDLAALRHSKAAIKISLGKSVGSPTDIGAKLAVRDIEDRIISATHGTTVAFVVVGTGGNTGAGTWGSVADILKEQGILVVVFAITPFSFEDGNKKLNSAVATEMRDSADVYVAVSNERMIRSVARSIPIHEAFKIVDNALVSGIESVYDYVAGGGANDKDKIQALMDNTVRNLTEE